MKKAVPFYESKAALEQYLFFHYGKDREYLPWPGPKEALNYPAAALNKLLDVKKLPENARALDLGCAVGRTSFELSRHCLDVIGIDLSKSFIRAANRIKENAGIPLSYFIEGSRTKTTTVRKPAGSRPGRIRFLVGDAMRISPAIGSFDVAVLLNLIDRVPDPARCLLDLAQRLNPGAQLIVASPYTWLEEYTPRNKWLGGHGEESSFEALKRLLSTHFELKKQMQIPFLIREHSRKYQWSMAEGTAWIRKAGTK